MGFISLLIIHLKLRRWILLFITLTPAFVAYLGHVEIRYFLHLYLIIYSLVAIIFVTKFDDFKKWATEKPSKKYWIIALSLLFIVYMNINTYRMKITATQPFITPLKQTIISQTDILDHNSKIDIPVTANNVYKVVFNVDKPSNCDKVQVTMDGVHKAYNTRLVHLYQKEYYVLFKPASSGTASITFTLFSDKCKLKSVKILE